MPKLPPNSKSATKNLPSCRFTQQKLKQKPATMKQNKILTAQRFGLYIEYLNTGNI
jgi:hypothetical protein